MELWAAAPSLKSGVQHNWTCCQQESCCERMCEQRELQAVSALPISWNQPLVFPSGFVWVGLDVCWGSNIKIWEIALCLLSQSPLLPHILVTAEVLCISTPFQELLGCPFCIHPTEFCLWWINYYWCPLADQCIETYCWRSGEGERLLLWQIEEHWIDLPGEWRGEWSSVAEDCGNSLCHRCK